MVMSTEGRYYHHDRGDDDAEGQRRSDGHTFIKIDCVMRVLARAVNVLYYCFSDFQTLLATRSGAVNLLYIVIMLD